MNDEIRCSECDLEMEEGFIPDATYGSVAQTCWHRGDAKAKKSFVDKLKSGSGVPYDKDNMLGITSYRCPRCGMLKLYAKAEAE